MDEFVEHRWGQRWGRLELQLELALLVLTVAGLALMLWREWHTGE